MVIYCIILPNVNVFKFSVVYIVRVKEQNEMKAENPTDLEVGDIHGTGDMFLVVHPFVGVSFSAVKSIASYLVNGVL